MQPRSFFATCSESHCAIRCQTSAHSRVHFNINMGTARLMLGLCLECRVRPSGVNGWICHQRPELAEDGLAVAAAESATYAVYAVYATYAVYAAAVRLE